MKIISALEKVIEYLLNYGEKDKANYLVNLKNELTITGNPQKRKAILLNLKDHMLGMGSLSDIAFDYKVTRKEDAYKIKREFRKIVDELYNETKKELSSIND